MKEKQDYIKDIAEIRSIMERSSKFLSLSGWAGILAGIYALLGAYTVYTKFNFRPDTIFYRAMDLETLSSNLPKVFLLGLIILILSLITAIFLSWKKAHKKGEKIWNVTSKRLLIHMSVPLVTGGVLVLILISKGLLGLIAPLTLLFYGLALYNAGKFTIDEVKFLGVVQIGLGLMGSYYVEYGLLFWAVGFGLVHIVYGVYMYFRYER